MSAAAVAVATPCCPAPVSAISRDLPRRFGEQSLTQNIIDLVASRVVQVFTLEEDPGPTAMLGKSSCFGDDGGSSGVRLVELIKLTRKGGSWRAC